MTGPTRPLKLTDVSMFADCQDGKSWKIQFSALLLETRIVREVGFDRKITTFSNGVVIEETINPNPDALLKFSGHDS
jgi:hypothetical protein